MYKIIIVKGKKKTTLYFCAARNALKVYTRESNKGSVYFSSCTATKLANQRIRIPNGPVIHRVVNNIKKAALWDGLEGIIIYKGKEHAVRKSDNLFPGIWVTT